MVKATEFEEYVANNQPTIITRGIFVENLIQAIDLDNATMKDLNKLTIRTFSTVYTHPTNVNVNFFPI